MNLLSFADADTALIVFGGTALGTGLRCGLSDCGQTLRALARLLRPAFNPDQLRAELARQIQDIRKDGLVRAQLHHFGDREFDDATAALIDHRSLAALVSAHDAHKTRRLARIHSAGHTLMQAAELAPVFGLAGTLISLGKLPTDGIDRGSYMAAIAMAVHATLYGLLAANLLLAPLARLVERRGRREEVARQQVIDWLARQLAPACPPAQAPGIHEDLAPAPELRHSA